VNVRRPVPEDAEAVLALLRSADSAIAGDSDWTLSEVRDEWAQVDLSRDAWLVDLDGALAGYVIAHIRGGRVSSEGYVRPGQHGRGVGSKLLELAEARAREEERAVPAGERVYLQNGTLNADPATERFYRERGFERVRGFWGMTIELEEEPLVPDVPGITIRPYDHPAEARAFHAAHQDGFASHWEFRPTAWEEWQEKRFGRETFDPTLWWVALDGEEIAGTSICEVKRDPDQGWVGALAVRPAYRRRGIADALLKTAFAEFFRRGETYVRLGVDAENPTGATRLYERAGMHVLWRAVVWEKELRAGD
jgi:mycothiol synthase